MTGWNASAALTSTDIDNFNAQYPRLTVRKTQTFRDRFIILDGKTAYHIGAFIKKVLWDYAYGRP